MATTITQTSDYYTHIYTGLIFTAVVPTIFIVPPVTLIVVAPLTVTVLVVSSTLKVIPLLVVNPLEVG
jgi:hypothetical protein